MSTASEVAGPGFGEETGRVPGATSTLMTNGSQIVSGGTGRGERDVGLFVRVLGLSQMCTIKQHKSNYAKSCKAPR